MASPSDHTAVDHASGDFEVQFNLDKRSPFCMHHLLPQTQAIGIDIHPCLPRTLMNMNTVQVHTDENTGNNKNHTRTEKHSSHYESVVGKLIQK